MAAAPDRYELHHQDETHVEMNPYLSRVWHRRGQQPTIPAAGTNRRLTVFGSVEVSGRGRVEVLGAGQTSADFLAYLEVLEQRQRATQREVFLVLDNGPCHRSKLSEAALAARADWLHVLWLPTYCPHLNRKERTGVALAQARCPRPLGAHAPRLRRWYPRRAGAPRWRTPRYRGPRARLVPCGPSQATHRPAAGPAQRQQGLVPARLHPPSELTGGCLESNIDGHPVGL